jgi:hypothetical protein
MADLSDVEQALVSTIAQVAYPNGTGNVPIAGTQVDIFRGWPIPADLDQDLAANIVNISVYPNDNERVTTRYPREWKPLPVAAPTLTLTVSGNTITVGGTPSSPTNAAAIVNGAAYVYAVQPNDTLTTIATGLAALIAGGQYTNEDGSSGYTNEISNAYLASASSSGPVITIPGAYRLIARVGAVGTAVRETKRQKRSFQITFWCPNPALRDLIVAPVDAALADIDFLSLPDGTAGRLVYERSKVSDRVEREGLYRRDLFYSVEYGTTDSMTAAQIVAELFNITGGLDPSEPAVTSFTI